MYERRIKNLSIVYVSLAALVFIIISGLRRGIGDTGMYMHSYRLMVQDPSSADFSRDAGFTALSFILSQISSNPQTLIFVVALITNGLNIAMLYKYKSYLELQLYLYMASGYFTVTMNGIRQCLAAALVFVCNKFIVNGDFKKYLIFVLLISLFHGSALIMIPIYFIVRQKAWSKNVVKLIFLACIGVIFYDSFSEVLFKALQNTQYGHYSEFQEGGSSIVRTIVNAVPVILAYIKRDELKEKWPESNIFVNMSLINVIFVAFGMMNWIFNRFSLYFQLYNFILLPFIIKNCFKGKERRLIYIGFLICYFIFFYKEQVIQLSMDYQSDYLNFEKMFYYTQ